jgi:hypothetical protein
LGCADAEVGRKPAVIRLAFVELGKNTSMVAG